jgi:hypothetical protein
MIINTTRILALLTTAAAAAMAADPVWQAPTTIAFHQSNEMDGKTKDQDLRETGMSPLRSLTLAAMPPNGFDETAGDETITVAGTSFACRKLVWTRQANSHAHLPCSVITAWTCARVDAPAFELRVPLRLPVPAGCVRFMAESQPGQKDLTLEWQQDATLTVGSRHLATQRYALAFANSEGSASGIVDAAHEIDAGLAGFAIDIKAPGHSGHLTLTLASMTDAPTPAGLVAYDGGRFGFAPPGHMTTTTAQPGELCRFADGGAWLAVATFDPAGKDLSSWFKPRMMEMMKNSERYSVSSGSLSFPVLSQDLVGYWDQQDDVEHELFIHAGRGYDVSFNHAGDMTEPDKQVLLANWRWAAQP